MHFTMVKKSEHFLSDYDIKEGEILRTEIKIGRVTVPAVFRED